MRIVECKVDEMEVEDREKLCNKYGEKCKELRQLSDHYGLVCEIEHN